ncbi:M12 family metallo-peptidase [Acidobacteriota bacterium]
MSRLSLFFKKKIHLFLGIFLIAGLAFAAFGNLQVNGHSSGSEKSKLIPLFTTAGIQRAGGDAITPFASRYRAVRINPLVSKTGGVVIGDQLFISPFEDRTVIGDIDRIETDVNGVLAIRARIQETDGYLLLSSCGGRSLGRLVLPDRREFEISCIGDGTTHIIQEFAPGARIALEGGPSLIPPPVAASESGIPHLTEVSNADSDTMIDCMIVYTPEARDFANTTSGINNFVSQAMQLAQLGMDNSLAGITMRLAYSDLIDYAETGDSTTDLGRLRITNDGHMDQVHTLRNTYGGDLVHLFTKTEDTGGLGYLLNNAAGRPDYAFSIGRVQQVSWGITTVHEMGHNMGCHHRKDQPDGPGPGLFSYSAGWRWEGNDNNKYCSIMSYKDDYDGTIPTLVEYFSNPSILYQGTPTGNAIDGDNARTLREIKTVISNYLVDAGVRRLTITAGPNGTTNPIPGVHTYDTGTVVSVTGLPNTNFRFLSWSGSVTGTQNPINVTVDQEKSIAASFQRIIYAPTTATGEKVLNRNLSLGEYINIISFVANTNNVNIMGYNIYEVEGGQRTLVTSLGASTFTYWHRGGEKTKEYTYHIVAVNDESREGAPAVVVVQ